MNLDLFSARLKHANPDNSNTLMSHSKLAQSLYPHPEYMPGKISTENEAESAKMRFRICVNLDLFTKLRITAIHSPPVSWPSHSIHTHARTTPMPSTENEGQRARKLVSGFASTSYTNPHHIEPQ